MNGTITLTIEDRLKKLIAEQLGVSIDDINPSSDLSTDLNADSLDHVELIMAIEDEFDVEIPDETAEGFHTVQNVVSYLEKNTKA